jgi:hypothetical protein
MAIETTEEQLRKYIRKSYLSMLKEEDETLTRDRVEALHNISFELAKKVANIIESEAMDNGIPAEKLFGAMVEQIKLLMKNK